MEKEGSIFVEVEYFDFRRRKHLGQPHYFPSLQKEVGGLDLRNVHLSRILPIVLQHLYCLQATTPHTGPSPAVHEQTNPSPDTRTEQSRSRSGQQRRHSFSCILAKKIFFFYISPEVKHNDVITWQFRKQIKS